MGIATVIILILMLVGLLVGTFPVWPHSRSWGFYPSGGAGLALVIFVILLLVGWV